MTNWRRVAYVALFISVAAVMSWLAGSTSFEEWTNRKSETVDDALPSENHSSLPNEQNVPDFSWEEGLSHSPLEINWRAQEEQEFVSPPYGPHLQALIDRATRGDTNAALLLYGVLEECRPAFDDRSVMDSAIDVMRQTHSIQLPSWDKPHRMRNPEALEQFIKATEQDFEICFPITAEQKGKSIEWLQLAVNGGNDRAVLYYARHAESSEEAISLLERAWGNGQPESLELLSGVYQSAYESGDRPEGHIDSLAAQYAYTLLLRENSGYHEGASLGEFRSAVSRLDGLSERLHEHERTEAVERASEMLENNQNCCTRF